jgi:hypothetical protein
MTYRALVLFALLVVPGLVNAATPLDTNHVQAIAAWLPAKPAGVGRPITDRAAWQKLASTPTARALLAKAQKLAAQPVPAVSDDGFLDYSRTGNRDRYQAILFARSDRLETLALAECIDNQGHFLTPLTETIHALCQERTWVYPAHDGKLNNFYGRTMDMDLRATTLAWELATADYLLDDKLPPATRMLIRENVRRRVLQPIHEMVEGRRPPIHWLTTLNNWNAVCLAGVTGAALALEDSPQDRAFFVAAAEHYIRYFLSGFTPDGYCSEGMGYWNYGFGNFLMLGETIRQATSGHVDLLADPAALAPALFCTRTEILNGMYPTISDCSPGSRPSPQFVWFISERFGLHLPSARPAEPLTASRNLAISTLFTFLPQPLPPISHPATAAESPLRSWFKEGGVLICRTGTTNQFAAVLKGGHNAESHNHNDVGSFSVLVGHSMLVCDPGGEVYTARTFGAHRYDSQVLSSFGHAVPVIADQLQRSGANARAAVLRADFSNEADTLVLDLRSAYPVPELQQLERTYVFHRATPELTVRDAVRFSDAKSFETALITWADWKLLSDNELLLSDGADAVRVRIDTGGVPFTIKPETLKEHVHTPKQPVRLGIALNAPVQQALVTLTITPSPCPTPASRTK